MSEHPRHHHRSSFTLIFVVLALALAAGCAGTTTIEQTWSPPGIGPARFQRVVAMYDSEIGTIQRSAEDRLVRRLAAQGVQAVPAHAILTDADRKDLEHTKLRLRASGYDGLVVMRLVDREQRVESSPSFDGYWGYGGYWGAGPYYSPYIYTETILRIETAVYALDDNKLVWSGVSRTIDPGDTRELVDDVTKVVAGELGKRGVVATREYRETTARL